MREIFYSLTDTGGGGNAKEEQTTQHEKAPEGTYQKLQTLIPEGAAQIRIGDLHTLVRADISDSRYAGLVQRKDGKDYITLWVREQVRGTGVTNMYSMGVLSDETITHADVTSYGRKGRQEAEMKTPGDLISLAEEQLEREQARGENAKIMVTPRANYPQ